MLLGTINVRKKLNKFRIVVCEVSSSMSDPTACTFVKSVCAYCRVWILYLETENAFVCLEFNFKE